jgi:hypothetical protein
MIEEQLTSYDDKQLSAIMSAACAQKIAAGFWKFVIIKSESTVASMATPMVTRYPESAMASCSSGREQSPRSSVGERRDAQIRCEGAALGRRN